MQVTFQVDGCTYLRIGNDIQLPDSFVPRGYVGIVEERHPLVAPRGADGPIGVAPEVERRTVGVFTPSAARALASIILSAATEARGA